MKKYPVALRAGTLLNGRYLIGRVLGQGGFGITYLAWDESLKARVAVKEYMPNDMAARMGTTVSVAMKSRAEDFAYGLERFQEEARTLAKFMGQPNIAGVTDYFDENGTSYFVMDYIEGISFKTYIANAGGNVSVEEALNVMIPVLRALTAVHAEGFIHRDVTPDNIYITKDGNVKLLDFGSARYSLGDKSKSLDVVLKVGYAPKEQYTRRGRQGPYTDVYSCAACLYAAITGFLPPESLERLDHDELIPLSQAGVEIPLYLERAILKGLAVQPGKSVPDRGGVSGSLGEPGSGGASGEAAGRPGNGFRKEGPAKPKKIPSDQDCGVCCHSGGGVCCRGSDSQQEFVDRSCRGGRKRTGYGCPRRNPAGSPGSHGDDRRGRIPGKPGRTGFIRKGPVRQRLGKPGADDGIKKSEPGRKPGYFRPDGPGRIDRFGGTETAKPFPDQWPCALIRPDGLDHFFRSGTNGKPAACFHDSGLQPLSGYDGIKGAVVGCHKFK